MPLSVVESFGNLALLNVLWVSIYQIIGGCFGECGTVRRAWANTFWRISPRQAALLEQLHASYHFSISMFLDKVSADLTDKDGGLSRPFAVFFCPLRSC